MQPDAQHPEVALRIAPLHTSREAAAILRVSARWLWGATARGEIRCVRLGRAVRYDARDLAAYIDRLRLESGAK
jgi:excisionase family DNA binding protein